MITGDHVTTAASIGAQLGIEGEAFSGTEFAALSDTELDQRLDGLGVVARVAPEDKCASSNFQAQRQRRGDDGPSPLDHGRYRDASE